MKKLILTPVLIVFFPLIFLTSCEKEKPLSELMIGKWEVEYITQVIYQNKVLHAEIKQYMSEGDLSMQLINGGSGIYSDAGEDYLFSWTFDGKSITIVNLFTEPAVWNVEMNGDKFVWSYTGTDSQDPTVTYEYFFTSKKVS
jgi:hypothetical protein